MIVHACVLLLILYFITFGFVSSDNNNFIYLVPIELGAHDAHDIDFLTTNVQILLGTCV